MILTGENRITRGEGCHSANPSTANPTRTSVGVNPELYLNTHFPPHSKHTAPPLQTPTGQCCLDTQLMFIVSIMTHDRCTQCNVRGIPQ